MGVATLMLACAASVARGFAPIRGATLSVLRRAGTTTVIDGLAELPLDQYDAIILDQYGVLHNGEALLDGVADALERLQAGGARKLVVLSNTSKRRAPRTAELPGRGFRSERLHDAICRGECWEALRDGSYASAVVLGWSIWTFCVSSGRASRLPHGAGRNRSLWARHDGWPIVS